MASALSDQMGQVAKILMKEPPNPSLSTKTELRWGTHGSMSVDLAKGTFFDHGEDAGGGVLDLIERETGMKGKDAFEWMRSNGIHIDDDRPQHQQRGGARGRAVSSDRDDGYIPPSDPSDYGGQSVPFDVTPRHEPEVAERAPPTAEEEKAKKDAQDAMMRARIGPPASVYDYTDENDVSLYQALRFEWEHDGKRHKTFGQRRPATAEDRADEKVKVRDGWVSSIQGKVRVVPYRLKELLADIRDGMTIYFVEGEKDVDNMRDKLGLPATCNPMGAGKWWPELTPYFADADIVILPDNDPQKRNSRTGALEFHDDGRPKFAGKDHADLVASNIVDVARSVRVLDLPGLPLKGDVTDWYEAGGDAEALCTLTDSQARLWTPPVPVKKVEPFKSRYGGIRLSDIDSYEGEDFQFIIQDLFSRYDVSIVAGAKSAGKSFLTIHASMCIVRNTPFFGHDINFSGSVIYQAGEGARGVRKRLKAYRKQFGTSPLDEDFILLNKPINLFSIQDTTNLIAEIKGWQQIVTRPVEMVVVDTYASATVGSNENDGKDVGIILDNVARIRDECHVAVCLVHHLNADGNKLRGHTSIGANIDQIIGIERDEATNIRTAKLLKQKDGEDNITFRFELKQVLLGYDDRDHKITSCVVMRVGEKAAAYASEENKGWYLRGKEPTFFHALLEAVKEDGILPPPGLKVDRRTKKVVSIKDMRRAYGKLNPLEEDIPEGADEKAIAEIRTRHGNKLKQQFKRCFDVLVRPPADVIATDGEYVWWTGRPVKGFAQTQPEKPREPKPEILPDDVGDLVQNYADEMIG